MRRLSRANLLELLLEERRLNDEQAAEIESLKAALEDKRITIESCGTMAEAAMKLNGVFSAIDAAAKQYKTLAESQARDIVAKAEAKAAEIVANAEKNAEKKAVK